MYVACLFCCFLLVTAIVAKRWLASMAWGCLLVAGVLNSVVMLVNHGRMPVTAGDFNKASLKGIPAVQRDDFDGRLFVMEGVPPEMLDHCEFRKVYSNGHLLVEEDFESIRKRVREN